MHKLDLAREIVREPDAQFAVSLERLLSAMDVAFGKAQVNLKPFPHFTLPKLFDEVTADAVLDWLEDAPWTAETSNFYTQHGCGNIVERVANTPAAAIGAPEVFHLIRAHLERVFGTTLSRHRFRLEAHRMVRGHRIGVHTDNPLNGSETHRLVLNFNRGFDDSYGGHLALFGLHDISENITIISPVHGIALAMELSAESWHCVDEIREGTRYSLLYSFWGSEESDADDSRRPDALNGADSSSLSPTEFDALAALLGELGANRIRHTSGFLIDHLAGTCKILQDWGCDKDVCKAGLFHSVLGTPSLPQSLVPHDRMGFLRNRIGERPFFLVRLFSSMDSPMLETIIEGGNLSDDGTPVTLQAGDLEALVSLVWANILEQSPRVPQSREETCGLKDFYLRSRHLLPAKSHNDVRELFTEA